MTAQLARALEGRVGIVTGGGSGIGEAISHRLAAAGAKVVVADISGEAAERVAGDIRKDGWDARAMTMDIADRNKVTECVDEVSQSLGRIDVLVNNAGIVRDAQLQKMDETTWSAVMDTNLRGTCIVTETVVPLMVAQGTGKVVNIASRSALGNFGQTNYAGSKAGIIGLTRSLAYRLGPSGINVNAIGPGYIETPIMQGVSPELRERAVMAAPLRRAGTPDDVAGAALFLASDEAAFVTGQCLFVCGGRSLGAALEIWS